MAEWGVANHIIQVNGDSGSVQVVDEVTVPARGVGETTYRIKETDFLWTASVAVSTSTFAHRTELKTESRQLESDYVRSEDFWGTAQAPMRHPPKFIPLNGEITFRFIDTSNASNLIALYLWGFRASTCGEPVKDGERAGRCKNPNCQCDRARWGQGRGLFVLSTLAPTTAPSWSQGGIACPAGGTASQSLKIPDLYHFRMSILNGHAYNGAGQATANATWKGNLERMDPRDERRGTLTSAQNAQARAAALVGSATAPNYLPSPVAGHKAGYFNVDVTDLGLATTNYIHLTGVGETLDDELLNAGR